MENQKRGVRAVARWKVTIEMEVEEETKVTALIRAMLEIHDYVWKLAICEADPLEFYQRTRFRWMAEKLEVRDGRA